jgi:sugar phosphate isomerase/epimerase
MSLPNPILLFNNHFAGHRRHYAYATRLAIAVDVGYDGYELYPLEPDNDREWEEAAAALAASGLRHSGMYVTIKGVNDDEVEQQAQQLERLHAMIERLARLSPRPFLNLTISSNPTGHSPRYHESGSAHAQPRHWERAAYLVRKADEMLAANGLTCNLYNHVWFIVDTPQAELRILAEAEARVIHPGIAAFHAHFHEGVPDPAQMLALPGMERLSYVALLNALPRPEPFRTVPIDQGQIDIAGLLAHLWQQGYMGPLVMQAYDLGGDPYVTAQRSIAYVREVWERFERNPALNPVVG